MSLHWPRRDGKGVGTHKWGVRQNRYMMVANETGRGKRRDRELGDRFDCIGDLERCQRQYALAIAYFEFQAPKQIKLYADPLSDPSTILPFFSYQPCRSLSTLSWPHVSCLPIHNECRSTDMPKLLWYPDWRTRAGMRPLGQVLVAGNARVNLPIAYLIGSIELGSY